jgi:hypothetical protein
MSLITCDVGKSGFHWYKADSDTNGVIAKKDKNDFLDLNFADLKSGDMMVIEDAHMREAQKNTLAFYFDYKDLKRIYDSSIKKNIEIRLFPQKSTPKARDLTEITTKSDVNDTKAIAAFLKIDSEAFRTLKKFNPTKLEDYQQRNQHVFEFLFESNEDINVARNLKYGFEQAKGFDYTDAVHQWVLKYKEVLCERLDHDEELMAFIGLYYVKNKFGKLKQVQTPSRIYTLVHSILRPDGQLRLRGFPPNHKYEGRYLPPHWKFIKENYFGLKANHMKSGVAASNYKHHWRIYVSDYRVTGHAQKSSSMLARKGEPTNLKEYLKAKKARTECDNKLRYIWQVLRKMIVEDGIR